jgi:hypothetical protein
MGEHDAENLLASDASRRIFSTAELANLQSILKHERTEGIDRLAASKATIEVTINPLIDLSWKSNEFRNSHLREYSR